MSSNNRSGARGYGTALILLEAFTLTVPRGSSAATLPVPCVSGVCGSFVTGGQAGAVLAGNTLTIGQSTDRAILNWASFNISADGSVVFNQATGKNAITLNRIHDANPSQIFGSLKSNGQIYLINQNGFLFGSTARVNVGGLLASSLNITDDTFKNGLLSTVQSGASTGVQNALFEDGAPATIAVQAGAKVTTNAAGQRILLAASAIENGGDLSAVEGGQVVLAAGQKVYVTASDDAKLRGLLVEVDGGGTVTNTGSVTAEHGNITAVGLAVNQNGRMTATTSVAENGSIRLLARDKVVLQKASTGVWSIGSVENGGSLDLGAASVTRIDVDSAKATAVDDQQQLASRIDLVGRRVDLEGGSQVIAHGGELDVIAASNPGSPRDTVVSDSAAGIRVAAGASIDLSGNVASTSVTRNLVAVELRANELADSPLQRDGVLRGQTVVIDAREGTPLANTSGATGLIGRDALERSSVGGTAVFDSAGGIAIAEGARIDVSGGAVNYAGGAMRTSQLIRADGSVVDIGQASPADTYAGLVSPLFRKANDRWGVIEQIAAPGIGRYEPGYVEGKAAGSLQFLGRSMVLAGDFVGGVTTGDRQRAVSDLPLGGQFTIGVLPGTVGIVSYRAPEVQLTSTPPRIVVGKGAVLPDGLPLSLTTDFITTGGFSRVNIASDKSIILGADAPLDLGVGGALNVVAPRVVIDGRVHATGGSLIATSQAIGAAPAEAGLFVGDGATLDVSGAWINDSALPLAQLARGAVAVDAGNIRLTQAVDGGTLQLGDDVALLANGGAWMNRAGAVTGGKGGGIGIVSRLSGNIEQTFSSGDHLRAEGFGVQGAHGGNFLLQAPRIQIGGADSWLAAQETRSGTDEGGALHVGTQLTSQHGFAAVTLVADGLPEQMAAEPSPLSARVQIPTPVLDVDSTARIELSTQTRMLNDGVGNSASAGTLDGLTTTVLAPQFQRTAVSLDLQAMPTLGEPRGYGALRVQRDAVISGDAGSSVKLTSRGDLLFDGVIDIAAGQVAMSVVDPLKDLDQRYVPLQLALGADSRIEVSGAAIYRPVDTGLLQGSLLDGGSVSLSAQRGAVATAAGSLIDIAGTQAPLDVQREGTGSIERREISSAAGSLAITAAETIALQGELQARGGSSNGVPDAGGSLSVTMTRTLSAETRASFPTGKRQVQLVNESSAEPVNGAASLDVDLLRNSGIDSLSLVADDEIAIGAGVDYSLARGLVLDAPSLAVLGSGLARLDAGYLTVGAQRLAATAPVATAGTGDLALHAGQIDLTGTLALRNVNNALFDSEHDINLLGYGTTAQPGGRLTTAGNQLTLRASRIAPTTRSQYTIASTAAGEVRFEQGTAATGVPLSVAGSLTVEADRIVQDGTLLAPFGSIALQARNSLQLLDGSLTSVSGAGSLLPYGRVDNGKSWVYGVDPDNATPVTAVPDRRIDLSAPAVTLGKGAVIDITGGGDLLAWQYTPGTGGSKDVLAGGALPDTYVIIPSLAGQAAPYDPMLWADSGLTPGQSLYIAGGSSVPAGVYTLLPARYALLPGAILVSPAAAGYQDLSPGTTTTAADGSAIVAGYRTFGSQLNAAARYSGFNLRAGSVARTLAQYEDRLASTFFVGAAADATTRVPRPADAGTLVVAVDQTLTALATLRAEAAKGGDDASVEIAAPQIQVTADGTGAAAGVVTLSSAVIDSWNLGRLLLGGKRDANGAIDVSARSVDVRGGAALTADEVVLVAADKITVDAGAKVASTSAATAGAVPDAGRLETPTELRLTGGNAGNAAVLAVSDLSYQTVDRGVAPLGAGGGVTLASGATVATQGAIAIDATGSIQLAGGSIVAPNASWALGAQHVVFGDATPAQDGLAIDAALSSVLQQARAIDLHSATSIDLARATTLVGSGTKPIESLTLSAASIDNLAPAAQSRFSAGRIVLNGVGNSPAIATPGTGRITFDADEIALDSGLLTVSGVDTVALQATGLVTGNGNGGISSAAALEVTASALTADSGAKLRLEALNDDVTLRTSGVAAPARSTLATGGSIAIAGRDVLVTGRILAPSGVVSIAAAGDLSLQDAAVIDAAGLLPANAAIGSRGGSIDLRATGALSAAPGSVLDVSAGRGADAGSIEVLAGAQATLAGVLKGNAATANRGGSLQITASSIDDLSELNRGLRAQGFNEERAYRVTQGDLTLGAQDRIDARRISLAADTGSVFVDGALTARSGTRRSSISIAAGQDISIGAQAALDASAGALGRGGDIEIASDSGHIRLAAAASVQAQGSERSGRLILRAPGDATDFNLDSLPADLSRVDTVVLQPTTHYALNGSPQGADFDAIRSDLATQTAGARDGTIARLGLGSLAGLQYQPYALADTQGDLLLPALDLSTWRFAGAPAALALRATGSITLSGDVSDGFSGQYSQLDLLDTVASGNRSSSIALSAADDVLLQDGVRLRTGTGDIAISAGRDLLIGAGASIYTGGVKGAATVTSSEGNTNYAQQGGSIELSAGRDVTGTVVTQSVNDWQLRSPYTTSTGATGAYWGVDFNSFGWNVGALGGGDVGIRAGRNAVDLSAAVADSAAAGSNGSRLALGGGNLSVDTAGDIQSGYFYVARGTGDLLAGGALGASGNRLDFSGEALGTLLMSGDTDYHIAAVGSVQLEGELQAFGLIPTRSSDDYSTDPFIFFNRYSNDSVLSVQSAGGDVRLENRAVTFLDSTSLSESSLAVTTQANVELSAFGGDLRGTADAIGSTNGQLTLHAGRDIVGGLYELSDVPAALYSSTNTSNVTTFYEDFKDSSAEVLHRADARPAQVSAGRDIVDVTLSLPKAVEVHADRDLLNLLLTAQHSGGADTTVVSAGRDLRNISGTADIGITRGAISVGGAGLVEVLAGRDVDLEFSKGIATTGSLLNANLPSSSGADVLVVAGLGVAAKSPVGDGLAQDSATLFAALVKSGREANTDPKLGFSRGFAAIEKLFPGSQPKAGETPSTFAGDITLPFSRVYTLSGGSIAMLAPGGRIDVGLATPPSGLSRLLDRGPSDLGIVAQGAGDVHIYADSDVNVNSSRIFTLGGGDIAIWSSRGNIDAGKGAKSAISAPAPVLLVDAQGNVRISVSSAVAGSGIRTIITDSTVKAGDVDLIAPSGFVNAGDAGIGSAGNLNIAAQRVVGLDNIQVGGASTGVPPETSGIGVSLSGATASASSSTAASDAGGAESASKEPPAALAQNAMSWLDVFVLGLGEDTCKQDDVECLQRQKTP